MMAGAAQRRAPEAAPAAALRSLERERLARVCAAIEASAERGRRLRLAEAQARSDRLDAFTAVERAAEVLDLAKREAPRRAAAGAIGEGFEGTAPPVDEAERSLSGARGKHQHLREVAEVLAKEIATAEQRLLQLRAERTAAIAAVIAPAASVMHAEYLAAAAWREAIGDVFRWLGPSRLPRSLQHWDATNLELPVDGEEPLPLSQWKDAIAALERGEADYPLPAIG